jgi:predicted Zn-dependent peptidase
MAEGTIDDKELAGAVDYLAGIFPIQIEENGPLADVVLRTLDQGLELDYLKSYRDRVRGVTRAQAETAARRNMSGTALSLIMVGTEEQTVANAKAQSSKVNIYDLDGKKVREEAGNLARLCTGR